MTNTKLSKIRELKQLDHVEGNVITAMATITKDVSVTFYVDKGITTADIAKAKLDDCHMTDEDNSKYGCVVLVKGKKVGFLDVYDYANGDKLDTDRT